MHVTAEHSPARVWLAPLGFGLAFSILGVASQHLAPNTTIGGRLFLAALFAYLVALAVFFYASARRVELHDGSVIATYFTGREKTCGAASLSRAARLSPTEYVFDFVALRDETGRVWCRVFREMEGSNALLAAIEAARSPGQHTPS